MFLSEADQKRIVDAIKEAELHTSGEIKVHIEKECPNADPIRRSKYIFEYLALHKTALRNGVLFYLAYGDRQFAILGDEGIDKLVTSVFWDSTKEILKNYFSKSLYADGLCEGITEAGKQLKKHFPYQSNDRNEIPDDISFG